MRVRRGRKEEYLTKEKAKIVAVLPPLPHHHFDVVVRHLLRITGVPPARERRQQERGSSANCATIHAQPAPPPLAPVTV
ncbi:hypothetical protein U1Q18_031832 [Sarracenia purpurea var. burkii]